MTSPTAPSIGPGVERREHFNAEPGVEGEMSVEFDIATGRAWSFGTGFWSLPQARAFFADWKRVIADIHAAGNAVSALVDMTGSNVQKAEVADLIATVTAGLYAEGDAVAMLVPTSLAKMQMRRVLDARFHQFFLSPNAAEMWLGGRTMAARQAMA